ncbi:hypothetical protein TWF506_005360 [Arthrobotrys conoides]|uniref:Uncharacterized protein n=1 Tax=Arthrobotrys conoides TaxID=74498 RepID=A0AAN8S328_9PEZI
MRSGLGIKRLGQWLTVVTYITAPLVRAQIVTIPFQSFKEGLKYSNSSTIDPLRTGISNLEKLTTKIYPIELRAGTDSPTNVRKTVTTKLFGLERGVDLAFEGLANLEDLEDTQIDLDALENVLERIREKFIGFSSVTIPVPNGFYTIPDQYKSQLVDIWSFINSLSDQLAANGALDNPEASAGRLVSFLFSAPLPDSGSITLDFDAFEIRVRTINRAIKVLTDIIEEAPQADMENFVKMIGALDSTDSLYLETVLVSGYEEVMIMLKTYRDAVYTIWWKADDLYSELRGLWL